MIVKFFSQGSKKNYNTSAKSVKKYLLDKREQDGTARIIRGDEPHTSYQIDLLDYANSSSTYTSGCLSFAQGETLDEQQKQELMASFESALLPDFDPTRYACYWVEHSDKNRLELNFVFAKIDLATGKHLDLYQQRRDVARLNYWKEIQIQKHGLIDPNAPQNERNYIASTIRRADGTTPPDKFKTIKDEINTYIDDRIQAGHIKNAHDIKKYIEFTDGNPNSPTGYSVQTLKSSVKITDTTTAQTFTIRGKGRYGRDVDFTTDTAQKQADYDSQRADRLATAKERYATLSKKRADDIAQKYQLPTQPPKPLPHKDLSHASTPTNTPENNRSTFIDGFFSQLRERLKQQKTGMADERATSLKRASKGVAQQIEPHRQRIRASRDWLQGYNPSPSNRDNSTQKTDSRIPINLDEIGANAERLKARTLDFIGLQSQVISPSTATDSIGYSGQIRLTKQLANTPQATISAYIAHTTDPDITHAIQGFKRLCQAKSAWLNHPFTHIPHTENAQKLTEQYDRNQATLLGANWRQDINPYKDEIDEPTPDYDHRHRPKI